MIPKISLSLRPVSSPLATTGTHLNNPSESGLEYAHSNSNSNLSNNNNINHIIQQNEHSLFQSDAITPNIHGFNYPREVSSKLYSYYYQLINFICLLITSFFIRLFTQILTLNVFITMIRRIQWEAMNTLLTQHMRMMHGMFSLMKLLMEKTFEI